MKTRISRPLLALGVCLGLAASAYAYVPNSSFIVQSMARKHSGVRGFKVRGNVTGLEDEKQTGVQFKQTTTYDAQTRVLRSRAYSVTGEELYAVERHFKNPPSDAQVNSGILTDVILFDADPASVEHFLKAAGIAIQEDAGGAALGRFKQLKAWVVGADTPAEIRDFNRPQLWVEKDAFLPMKTMANGIEIRFENYRFAQEFPAPRTITVAKPSSSQEGIFLSEEQVDFSVNPDLSEFKSSMKTGFTEAGNMADTSLRDLISRYYRYVR